MRGRILLVDDEAPIRNVLRRLLARRLPEVEVSEAASAEEALAMTRGASYDVVLTDYRMDGATGADLLRQLESECPATARVLATGYQDDAVIEDAIRGIHIHARFPKPWDNDEVIRLLTRLVEVARAAEAAPHAASSGIAGGAAP